VAGDRQEIDTHRFDIERELAGRLRRVGVKEDAASAAERADRGEILDRADFVVDGHDGDERGARPNRFGQRRKIEKPIAFHRHHCEREPFALELPAGFQHAFMLGRDGDDAIAVGTPLVAQKTDCAFDRRIVGFRRPRGEDDLARFGADQRRDIAARALDRLRRLAAEAMTGRMRVAEFLGEIGQYRRDDARVGRRRRLIVGIDRRSVGAAVDCRLAGHAALAATGRPARA